MHKLKGIAIGLLLITLTGCATVQRGSSNELGAQYNAQLGIAYLQQGNMPRAKEKLNLALRQADYLPVVHYSLGYFYEHTGEVGRAESAFKQGVKLSNGGGPAHNNYGAFLCRQSRFLEAEEQFLLAINDPQYTDTAESYENAGLCALQAKKQEKAGNYFKLALRHDGKRGNALLELAGIAYQKKHYRQTLGYIKKYQDRGYTSARSLIYAIKSAERLGEREVYVSNVRLLKHRYPNSKELKQLQKDGA